MGHTPLWQGSADGIDQPGTRQPCQEPFIGQVISEGRILHLGNDGYLDQAFFKHLAGTIGLVNEGEPQKAFAGIDIGPDVEFPALHDPALQYFEAVIFFRALDSLADVDDPDDCMVVAALADKGAMAPTAGYDLGVHKVLEHLHQR